MPAELDLSAGRVISNAAAQTNSTAPTGTRLEFSRVQIFQPGIARSRENAYVIREALVTQAMPQNSWPMQEMKITISPAVLDSALSMIDSAPPPPSAIALESVAANV